MDKQSISMAELQSVFSTRPRLMVVMGVSGSGKSTIAKTLADVLPAVYLDGDDYHPAENIAKMARGEALSDDDRWPWLENFAGTMAQQMGGVVGACSALTRSYRECITKAAGESVLFIYLDGSRQLIRQRLAARENHFMPDSLLDSQLATLEPPSSDELALMVDIQGPAAQVINIILDKLRPR